MTPLGKLFRQPVLLWLIVVALVAGVLVAVLPREPYHFGKPLGYWLAKLPATVVWPNGSWSLVEPSDGEAEKLVAFEVISNVGPGEFHVVVARLGARNQGWAHLKQRIEGWALKLHLLKSIPAVDFAEVRRGQAVTAFIRLGEAARPAFPQVIALAKSDPDPGVRASALEVLRRLSLADYTNVAGQTNMVSAAAR